MLARLGIWPSACQEATLPSSSTAACGCEVLEKLLNRCSDCLRGLFVRLLPREELREPGAGPQVKRHSRTLTTARGKFELQRFWK